METRSHVNPDCLCPHSVPYSERSLSFAANVHRPAWLTLQNCGLLKSVLGRKRGHGRMTEMNSVGLGKSFGVSVSFVLELKYG